MAGPHRVRVQMFFSIWIFAQDGEGWETSCVEPGVTPTKPQSMPASPYKCKVLLWGTKKGLGQILRLDN